MASVKSDLNLYDDAGFIDQDRVIKVISSCNEKLGLRIYKSRECKIKVYNYKAELPEDFYKVENIFATQVCSISNTTLAFGARQVEFTNVKPKDTTKIITYGKMGCVDSCNNCYWVEDRRPTVKETEIQYEKIIPLSFSNKLLCKFMEYSPCDAHIGKYKVDLDEEEEELVFSFKEGEIYMSYLGNLISDDGEIEIPFHPKLNPYYEYAVMEKILEVIYLNSEADIIQKLQYIKEERRNAYAIAWDFANTRQVNEWNKIQKNFQREYYNKWYKILN